MSNFHTVKDLAKLMSGPLLALALVPCLQTLYRLVTCGAADLRIFYSYWQGNILTFLNLNPVYGAAALFYLLILFSSWIRRQDRCAAVFLVLYVNIFFGSFLLGILDMMEHSTR